MSIGINMDSDWYSTFTSYNKNKIDKMNSKINKNTNTNFIWFDAFNENCKKQ